MPVSSKRKDIKHISKTGRCKTLKGKQIQNGDFHMPNSTSISDGMSLLPTRRQMMKFFKRKMKKVNLK